MFSSNFQILTTVWKVKLGCIYSTIVQCCFINWLEWPRLYIIYHDKVNVSIYWAIITVVYFIQLLRTHVTHQTNRRRRPVLILATGLGFACNAARGVRVYPYPQVYPYPTRTRGYGSGTGRCLTGRVRSGTGTKSTGTGIPVFTRREHHFHDVGAISNVFLFLPY